MLDGPDEGHLEAQRASIRAGSRTMTLGGQVEASQRGMSLRAEDVVLVRREDGRLESVVATPAVTGTAAGLAGAEPGVRRARGARPVGA